jgi:hypothetical protein
MNERIASTEYGPGALCSDCGTEIDIYSPEWTEYCYRHAERRSDPFVVALEELVEAWKARNIDGEYHAAANELEDVIEEHTD